MVGGMLIRLVAWLKHCSLSVPMNSTTPGCFPISRGGLLTYQQGVCFGNRHDAHDSGNAAAKGYQALH